MKTMKLALVKSSPPKYRVLLVKNSTVHSPGDVLTESEVNAVCVNGAWDVTIVAEKQEGGAA